MKEICRRARLKCEFKYPVNFGELLPGLEEKKWDTTIAGMGITATRELKFDFAGPYYKASKFFFGRKNKIINQIPQDLVGTKIGVQSGTVRVDYINFLQKRLEELNLGTFEVFLFANDTEMDAALKSDSIDFVIKDTGNIDGISNDPSYADFSPIGPELSSKEGGYLFGRGDGIGLRKGDKLQYLYNKALQEMFYDCTYSKIESKHFKTKNVLVPQHCIKQ